MTKDEAIERAQKLLALSRSDNVHEAAAAMQQAQAILLKFGIEQTELEDQETEEEIEAGGAIHATSKFNMDTWCIRLASNLAASNQCRALLAQRWVKGREMAIIEIFGRPSDIKAVRFLYAHYLGQINWLSDRDGKGQGRTWRNNFRHGCVDTLELALLRARSDARESNERGLIRLDMKGDAVAKWIDSKFKTHKHKFGSMTEDDRARELGRQAGEEIRVSQARGALK